MLKSIIKFVKDWTLPVAMVFGSVVYLIFAYTPSLDEASQFFGPIFDTILPMFMFFILFVTFCKVDFHKMRIVPWHLWVGMFQLLFVGILMLLALQLPSAGGTAPSDWLILIEAILMCVIAPCATAAAVVTQKLGGSLEQMTTYTFMSNLITVALVPVCFPVLEKSADITFLSAFTTILREVFLVLVVPMIMAYIVKHYMHRLHRKIISVRDLSYYLWGCSLTIVTGTTVKNIVHADTSPGLLLAIAGLGSVMCVVQYAVGSYIGRYFGRTQEAAQALGQKNTAFAIWMAYTYLNPLSSVGPGCYILWQNIVNSIEIWAYGRGKGR